MGENYSSRYARLEKKTLKGDFGPQFFVEIGKFDMEIKQKHRKNLWQFYVFFYSPSTKIVY